MKKGIIFDVDGTLWDSATQVAQSWQVAAEKLLNRPRPITPDMISRNMGKNMKDFGDALFPDLPPAKRLEVMEACMEYENQYLEDHPETKAVLSGGQGEGELITEARAMYHYLTEHGIAPERLFLEERSVSTAENLRFSRELIGADHSVGVVTNNFHVFRGTAIARKCGFREAYPIPSRYSSWRLLIYIPREILAILKDKLLGNW